MKQPLLFTLLSSAACVATAADKAPKQTTPEKAKTPNVVFIYADDLGYGDLECYGAKNVQTPNVNRLAKSGIRFTNAHATAATSTPSRYSMLTGEYAWRKKRNRRSCRKCRHDYPSRTIYHGGYVQKYRLCYRSYRKMALGIRRQSRYTRLERSTAMCIGRLRI